MNNDENNKVNATSELPATVAEWTDGDETKVIANGERGLPLIVALRIEDNIFLVWRNGKRIAVVDRGTGTLKTCRQYVRRGTKAQGYTDYSVIRYRKTNYAVHRLVAMAFVPNPDNKPIVHHANGNSLDNSADNLLWVTPEEHKAFHRNNGKAVRWDWEKEPTKRTFTGCAILYPDGTREDFDSLAKAGKRLRITSATVKYRIEHETIDANGRKVIATGASKRARKIVGINLTTGKRRTFRSQCHAAKELGLHQGNINRCLNTLPGDAYYLASTGGWRFIYKSERGVA